MGGQPELADASEELASPTGVGLQHSAPAQDKVTSGCRAHSVHQTLFLAQNCNTLISVQARIGWTFQSISRGVASTLAAASVEHLPQAATLTLRGALTRFFFAAPRRRWCSCWRGAASRRSWRTGCTGRACDASPRSATCCSSGAPTCSSRTPTPSRCSRCIISAVSNRAAMRRQRSAAADCRIAGFNNRAAATGWVWSCCAGAQVKDTLGALQERFRALKIDGGSLPISRLQVSDTQVEWRLPIVG